MNSPINLDLEAVGHQLQHQLNSSDDLYIQLNAVRNWINQHMENYELYLEDVWNEKVDGETHFEYILRSKDTLNETEVLGYDVYLNHQDAKGVWHLDEYVKTIRLIGDSQPLLDFIQQNTPIIFKSSSAK